MDLRVFIDSSLSVWFITIRLQKFACTLVVLSYNLNHECTHNPSQQRKNHTSDRLGHITTQRQTDSALNCRRDRGWVQAHRHCI